MAENLTKPPLDATKNLTRSALSLIFNSMATSALGMVFWVLAARLYDPAKLGQDAALVSLMLLLAAISELNFGLALPRFLPSLGKQSANAVLAAYAASSLVAVTLTTGVALIAPHISSSLQFLGGNFHTALVLIGAVALWNIFALQDAVLAAIRKTEWIPVENIIVSIAKIILMVIWAKSTVHHGVFLSWVIPMAVILIPVNIALFRWALPQHMQTSTPAGSIFGGQSWRSVIRFLALDYIASLLVQASTSLVPLVVLVVAGVRANADFYIAFTVSMAVDQLVHNVGLSLTIEGAFNEAELNRLARHTFVRFGVLLIPAVIGVVVLAKVILWFFGPEYVHHSASVLRLLAIAALPQAALTLYQALERVRGNAGRILLVTGGRSVLVLTFVYALGQRYGLTGAGVGWLLAHIVMIAIITPELLRLTHIPKSGLQTASN